MNSNLNWILMSVYHNVIHTLRVWSWMNVIEMEKGSKYVLRSDARALWSCIKSLCSLFIIWVRYTANTRTKNSISQDVGVVCIWHICFFPIATLLKILLVTPYYVKFCQNAYINCFILFYLFSYKSYLA